MVQRYNPDYVMHAARFAPFARENEHGEYVKFSDYEALKAERDALAVENAALKEFIKKKCFVVPAGASCLAEADECAEGSMPETPATSAALAAIQAQGVEKAASALDALSAQSASATTQGNFRAAAVYLRTTVLPAIGEAK